MPVPHSLTKTIQRKTAAARLDVAIKKRAIGQKSWLAGGSRIMEDDMEFPTKHEDLRKAWLCLRNMGQAEHAETVWQFADMLKRTHEQMVHFQNLANELKRKNNQNEFEEEQLKAIKIYSRSRKADNS